ncbi:hypothetical protein CEXT_557181 [Caerostris extrusa]|uniref:Uncharacterized protein n=1 Tax=Caerostris extrusa TaxID=172846 RepID=A0AAV4XNF1_CAEEX|nr:hypothetical protein CEXT_557181 [Caerostris extrusa]
MVERYVKAACEEPVSHCPPSRRQRCSRDTARKSAQKSLRADHTQNQTKSLWTTTGGQVRPPVLAPFKILSFCCTSPSFYYKRKQVSCVVFGGSGSTRSQLRTVF